LFAFDAAGPLAVVVEQVFQNLHRCLSVWSVLAFPAGGSQRFLGKIFGMFMHCFPQHVQR
jgi:hypothetical protein